MAKITTYTCDRCKRPIDDGERVDGPTIHLDGQQITLGDLHPKCNDTINDLLRRALLRAHPEDGNDSFEDQPDDDDQPADADPVVPDPVADDTTDDADPPADEPKGTGVRPTQTVIDDPPADSYAGNTTVPAGDDDLTTDEDAFDREIAQQAEQVDETSEDPADLPEPAAPEFRFDIGESVEVPGDDGEIVTSGKVTSRTYDDPPMYEVTPEDGKPQTYREDDLQNGEEF